MVDVCLLGCGGTLPAADRNLTALLLNCNGKKILIDCGEGTQVSMKQVGWGFKSIEVICFTHAHADHVIGLPGLLLTIANSDRTEPLTIIGPPGFDKILEGLMVVCPYLPYEVKFIEAALDGSITYSIDNINIKSLILDHSSICVGYCIDIDRSRKFDSEKAKALNIPVNLWGTLQKGGCIENFTPEMVLGDKRKGIRISYCTDTRPTDAIIDFIRESQLFIAEGMYGSDEDLPKAIANKHMIFREAAQLAKDGAVEELWLTHFSPSLTEPEIFLENTTEIFPNTIIGKDRMVKALVFDKG